MRLRWFSAILPALMLLTMTPIRPAAADSSSVGRVSGVVEDESGVAMAAAKLRFLDGTGATAADVTADGHGRYETTLPTGTYQVTVNASEQRHPVSARIATVDVTGDTPLDIAVAGGPGHIRHLDGTVVDPTGAPLPDARIMLDNSQPTTLADANGHFDLAAQPGTHYLRIEATEGATAYSFTSDAFDLTVDRQQRFTLSPPEAPTTTAPAPPPPVAPVVSGPYTVSGTVTGADGTPLPYVRVAVGPVDYSTPTGLDGRYSFNAPAGAGTLNLTWTDGDVDFDYCETPADCQGAEYTLAVANFHPESAPSPLDLHLPPGTFTVRVLDYTGQPVEGAVVTADSTAPAESPGGATFPGGPVSGHIHSLYLTGADGQATIPMIPGHAPGLHVDPPSDRGLPIEITPAAGANATDVTVPGGVRIHGAITDTNGQRASFVNAALVSTDGKVQRPLTLAADRLSYAVLVPPGQYRLSTDIDDHAPGGESDDHYYFNVDSAPFDVGADRQLDFTLPPSSAAATIAFVDPEGQPVDGGLSLYSASAANGLQLAPGIQGSGSASHYVFGSTSGDQVVAFPGGTLGADFSAGTRLTVSGLPVTPGGLVIVAEAQGSDLAPTDQPQDLQAQQTGPGTITVRWSPPPNDHGSAITGYGLWVADSHQTWILTTATSTVLSGLTPGAGVFVAVYVMTSRGLGSPNDVEIQLGSGQQTPAPLSPSPGSAPSGGGQPPSDAPAQPAPTTTASGGHTPAGYWALGSDGHVYNFGDAAALGNADAGAVTIEPTPTGKGYWTLNRNGTVQAFGDAMKLGDVDMSKLAKGEAPASLSATPSGKGYWVFTNRGRAIIFGDAPFLGDMNGTKLNGPVLGSVATPTGKGYYMVASDGGIFAFGDAAFAGSMGGKKLNASVQSLVPDADGHGYWLVAADGGIFAFDAPFRGSMGGTRLNKPVVGMVRYGDGYLMVGADGGIFNFSTSPFAGSLGDKPPAVPVVAVAAPPR